MNQGIYEELITQLVRQKINGLQKENYYVNKTNIDKEEASLILSRHLSGTIKNGSIKIVGD